MSAAARGKLVLVGGHSRGVGKTAVGTNLLRAFGGSWIAVKVSSHRHAAIGNPMLSVVEETAPSDSNQSGRYLAAGAARAFLARAPEEGLDDAAGLVESLLDSGSNVVVESNRLIHYCRPDLVLFVIDPLIADWKASSGACFRRADVLVMVGCGREISRALAGVPRGVYWSADLAAMVGSKLSLTSAKTNPSRSAISPDWTAIDLRKTGAA